MAICPVAGAENVLWTGKEAGVIQPNLEVSDVSAYGTDIDLV